LAKPTIIFHNKRHPSKMGAPEIEAFLSHLVGEGNVSASTQNHTYNALLLLYRNVLHIELTDPILVMLNRGSKAVRSPLD